jgi:sialidase-1
MNFRSIFNLVLAAIPSALLLSACTQSQQRPLAEEILFQTAAPDTVPYRIPAMGQLPDGSILALSDYRPCQLDIGFGQVDIHGRISSTDGSQWGDEFVLVEGTGIPATTDCGFGDPAMVVDRETGEVLVVMVCGNTVYYYESTNRQNPNRVACMRSKDGGKTWTPWEEITENIYTLFDQSVHGCVQSLFFSSGKIVQSSKVKVGSHYRLYHALAARPNGNRVIYSDDFGYTWHALGGPDALPVPHGDEAKCEELPDGSVVVSSRTMGGRWFNVFTYDSVEEGTGVWDEPVYSGPENNGCIALDNACNGEILIVPATKAETGENVNLALQSVPLGPKRAAVGIYYKEVKGGETAAQMASDWSGPYRVTEKPSAYSTMIHLQNRNVGFYYEECDSIDTRGYDMVYKELPLSKITSNSYTSR